MVATPSSKLRPLKKDISKSLVSNDIFFLLLLFVYNSWACSKIISFLFPFEASVPSLSNFFCEFFLTHESIRQFPGPISLLIRVEGALISLIKVIFEIPPKFRKHTGSSILFCIQINWWKIGVSGAPWPPLRISLLLKS